MAEAGNANNSLVNLTGLQKAAIFLVTLGQEKSADVLRYMSVEDVEMLTYEIVKVDKVDSATRTAILKEFQEMIMARDFIVNGGVDYAKGLLEGIFGAQKAVEMVSRLSSVLKGKPFEFVRRTDPQHLVNLLQFEHPQTIALVLAFVEPKKASEIVAALAPEIQSDVARRIARMDRTNPEIIREVERVLERKIAGLASEDYSKTGGVDVVVELLNSSGRSTEKFILENLEKEDPELAEEIKKKMFVFEDIVLLDDKSIQRVIREVDNADIAKALKSVDDEVKNKIYKNMSKRAAEMIKEEIEFMGPIRLNEVEEIQQKIVGIIRKLEESGEVVIVRVGEDELV